MKTNFTSMGKGASANAAMQRKSNTLMLTVAGILLLLLNCVGANVFAGTFTSNGGTNPTLAGSWTAVGAVFPGGAGDTYVIANNMTVPAAGWSPAGSVTINTGQTLTCGANALNVGKALTVNGTGMLSTTTALVSIGGNWTNANGAAGYTFTAGGAGAVTFTGGSAQTITGSTSFNNITISNVSGVSATASVIVTVNGLMAFTSGKYGVGPSGTLIFAAGATVSGMTRNSGTGCNITGSTTSSIDCNNTGALGTLIMDETSATTETLKFLSIFGAGGSVTLGSPLTLNDGFPSDEILRLATGTLNDGGFLITCKGSIGSAGDVGTEMGAGGITIPVTGAQISGGVLTNLTLNPGTGGVIKQFNIVTINGALIFATGKLALDGLLVFGANATVSGMTRNSSTGCNITGSKVAIIACNNTSALGTLIMDETSNATKTIKSLQISGVGGIVTLGSAIILGDSLTSTTALLTTNSAKLDDAGFLITCNGNAFCGGSIGEVGSGGVTMPITGTNIEGNFTNLAINPGAGGVIKTAVTVVISGVLTFTSGKLALGANSHFQFKAGGTLSGMTRNSSTGCNITGNATADITCDASSAPGTLIMDETSTATETLVELTLKSASSMTLGAPIILGDTTVSTALDNAGLLLDGGFPIICSGNITGGGLEEGSGGITMINDSTSINAVFIQNLKINPGTGTRVSLAGALAVPGTLTLTSGQLMLGTNNLSLVNAVAGTPSLSNMIVANGAGLVKASFSGAGSYTYPIGDSTHYTPITLNVTGGTFTSANVGVNVATPKPVQNANSGSENYLKRYWNVTPTGITSPSVAVTSATYISSVDISGTESSIKAAVYTGAIPWIRENAVNTAAHTFSTVATAVTSSSANIFTGINSVTGLFAGVSANTVICTGGSATLTAAGSTANDGPISYSWSPASSLSATSGISVIASPTVITTYTLTVTDGNGFTVSNTTRVMVASPVIAGNNVSIYQGGSTTLAAGGAAGYNWSPATSLSATSGTSVTANPTSSTIYTVTGTTPGCGLNTAEVTVSVDAIPTLSSGTGCAGSVLTVTSSSVQPTQIVWQQGGVGVSTVTPTLAVAGIEVAGTGFASGTDAAHLYVPYDVFVDGSGNVYVADAFNARVQKWAPGASVGTTVAGVGIESPDADPLGLPTGVFVDGSGNLYVSDGDYGRVQKWAPGAVAGVTVASGLNYPGGIYVDGNGNVYVADAQNNRVQKWAPGATAGTTVAGTGVPGNAPNQLNTPHFVTLDGSGNVYVSDNQNSRVQKWAPGATAGTTVAGTGISGTAANQFAGTAGIYVDGSGNLYVSDQGNSRVQKWAAGVTTGITVAGTGVYGTASNQFEDANGLYVDANGNLYVEDASNSRVMKFTASITTSLTATTAGNYTALVTTAAGNVTTNMVTINVLPTVGSTGGGVGICSGATATLNGTGAASYSWTGGITDGVAFTPTVGVHHYTVTGTNGCGSNIAVTTVSVNSTPLVIASGSPGSTCAGHTVTLTGIGTATTYSWTGGITNGVAFTPAPGVNNYTVTGTTGSCSATATTSVSVNALPAVGSTGGGIAICAGGAATLTGTGATTYSWTGGITNGSAFTPATGINNYTVTGTTGSCSNTATTVLSVNALPVVGATGGGIAICSGTTATLSGTGATSYSWSGGITDGAAFTPLTGINNYTVTGTTGSCSNTATAVVSVNATPTVGISGGNVGVCTGGTATLSGTGATSYSWTGGITNGVSFTPGAGVTTYTVVGSTGSCSNTATTTVTVSAALAVGASGGGVAICAGSSLTLNGTGATSYGWSGGITDGVAFAPATGVSSYTVTGSAGSCSNTATTTVTVNALPVVGTSGGGVAICAGNTATLHGTGAASYSWSGGIADGVVFTPSAGINNYTVTGTTGSCSNTATTSVSVNALPIVGTSGGGITMCPGNTATLAGTGATTYSWSGGITDGVAFSPSLGVNTYTVTGTTGSCTNTATTTVTVNVLTVGVAGSGVAICAGDMATLSGTGASSYSWSGGITDGVSFNPATGINTYTVTGSTGSCSNTATATVTVTALPVISGGYNVSIYNGSSTILNGAGSTTYTWAPGTALSATVGASVTANPSTSVIYTVTGTTGGCSNTAEVTVSVAAIPTLGGSTVCPGSVLTVTSALQPTQIVWQLGGAGINTITATIASDAVTVAGTGTPGSGAGQLNQPTSVFVDGNGNVYVCDWLNNRVQEWAPGSTAGITVAGGNGAGAGATQLNDAMGISVDASGNIYIADANNSRIQKWAPGSTAGVTVAGTGSIGVDASSFNSPFGVFVDGSGNIYVADRGNHRVQKWAPGASAGTTVAGTGIAGSGSSQLNEPNGVFVDGNGNLFIADWNNNRVQEWAPGATSGVTVAGTGVLGSGASQLAHPGNVFVDKNGSVYASDGFNARIQKWAPGATAGITVAGTGTGSSGADQLSDPGGVYVDGNGDIYVADHGNSRVQEFAASIVTTLTATAGGNYTALVSTAAGTITTNAVSVNELPTVGIVSSSNNICAGDAATLSGTGADLYSWSGGITDGTAFTPSTGVNNYTVTGTMGSCSNTATTAITVNALPTVGAAGGDIAICSGSTATLSGTGAGSYSWSGGITDGVAFTPSAGVNTYTVTGTTGTCSNSATASVTVNATPVAGISGGGAAICAGDLITLSGTGADSYSWSGGIADGVAFTPAVGVNTYTVTGTTGSCSNTATTTITVNAVPTVGTSSSSLFICAGSTATLSGTGADSYSWSGGITDGVPFTPAVGFNFYFVTGTTNGCSNTAIAIVNVSALPTVGISGGDVGVCTGGTATLSGTGAATYSWSGGITDGVAFTPGAGVTSYTVIGTTGSCSNTATTTVTVSAALAVGAAGGGVAICAGDIITLTGTGATTYSWTVGITNGLSFAPATGVNTYTVTGSSGSCSNTATTTITVNALPIVGATGGGVAICAGNTATLHGTGATSYSWTGGITDGVSFAPAAGINNYTVTGTTGSCSNTATTTVTVNALPVVGTTGGNIAVCSGSTATLHGTGATTYSWSGGIANGVAFTPAVGINSYTVTGTTGSCSNTATTTVTVNATPTVGTSGGGIAFCAGGMATLSGTGATSYSWTGGITNGVAFTPAAGVNNYTVTGTTGSCSNTATATLTVNATSAGTITGPSSVIIGSTINLTDVVGGGVWSASNGSATVSGGVVTGVAIGPVTISYSVTGACGTTSATRLVIVGSGGSGSSSSGFSLFACVGTSAAFWGNGRTAPGTWTMDPGSVGVATVSAVGLVTGISEGTATMSYTAGGPYAIIVVTVYPVPAPITGTLSVCQGLTTTLTNATPGGVWQSNIPATAPITSGGVVTGTNAGTVQIYYTLVAPAGCRASAIVTVNTNPAVILGPAKVCTGASISLSDGTAGGAWSGTNAHAGIDAAGNVTGLTAGTVGVTYTSGTGCIRVSNITVNQAAAPISGNLTVCAGYRTTLSDAVTPGVSWTSGNTSVATIAASGVVSGVGAGTATITYTLANTCAINTVVTVNPTPSVPGILGASSVSHGGAGITLSDLTGGGVWSSSNTAILTVGSASGHVNAVVSAGSASINYIVVNGFGCSFQVSKVISTSPAPHDHGGGTETTIVGGTVSLADELQGGEWVSGNTNVATVDENGAVTGVDAGNVTVTHTVVDGSGDVSTIVTTVVVNSIPMDVRIVPNPNNGTFALKGVMGSTQDVEVTLEVTDVLGQVIYSNKVTAQGGRIGEVLSLNNTLANGMYLMNIHTASEQKVFHFVIEK